MGSGVKHMNSNWHATTLTNVTAYFDVDPAFGLRDTDVLTRLKRFGNNTDPSLLLAVQRCMNVKVRRNNRVEVIKFNHVVPGDIVMFEPGDRVPADIRLLHVNNLIIDQSQITGESAAVKNTFAAEDTSPAIDQKCIIFAGSFVVSGSGYGVVVARGKDLVTASLHKNKRAKRAVKHGLLMRRLKRYGIVTHNQKSLEHYKDVDFVVVEISAKDSEIIDVIRKVQLTQRIPCKFLLPIHQAARLAGELNALVWDISQEKDTTKAHVWSQIDSSQFIVNYNDEALIKCMAIITSKNHKILWITDGIMAHKALQLATVSLAIGSKIRGDVLAKADLIAPAAKLNLITRILYNNK